MRHHHSADDPGGAFVKIANGSGRGKGAIQLLLTAICPHYRAPVLQTASHETP